MELELKHLAPYLPYGLRVKYDRPEGKIDVITSLYDIEDYDAIKIKIGYSDSEHIWMFKPVLKPMSDLTQEELKNAGFDSHIDYLTHELQSPTTQDRVDSRGKKLWRVEHAPYEMVAYLFQRHFDVFGLIPAGLAIDINTLDHV